MPLGWYGHAKFAAERLILEFGRRHGLIYTILRVSNPYGFQVPLHKPQGLIPIFLKHAREDTPLTVWGDGSARKDFIHYTDFTSALAKIVQSRLVGIFNVSSNQSHSVNEVIGFAEQALGKKIVVRHIPAHPWDVHDSLLDNTKLRSAVDWQPTISLADGIRRAIAELT
jgi:UDP-glucose 4-epimerase